MRRVAAFLVAFFVFASSSQAVAHCGNWFGHGLTQELYLRIAPGPVVWDDFYFTFGAWFLETNHAEHVSLTLPSTVEKARNHQFLLRIRGERASDLESFARAARSRFPHVVIGYQFSE